MANQILTKQQSDLVELIAQGFTHDQAKVKAGYSPNTAMDKVLKLPHVAKELAKIKARTARANRITRNTVIEGFKDAIDDAKTLSDPQAQISGWREIAKVCGLYEPEKKILRLEGAADKVQRQLGDMTQQELMSLIDEAPIEGEFEEVEDGEKEST